MLDRELNAAFHDYLSARGVVYEPESPCVVERPCLICGAVIEDNLGLLDEEERAVWHQLADCASARWDEKRRTGRYPEISEEVLSLEKWLRRRFRAKVDRVFGKHGRAAAMFAYRRAKKRFTFASDLIDEELRRYEEAGADKAGVMEDVSKCQ